jgi:hypothetical protein
LGARAPAAVLYPAQMKPAATNSDTAKAAPSPIAKPVPPHAAASVPARIRPFPQTTLRFLFQKRTKLTSANKMRMVAPVPPAIAASSRGPKPSLIGGKISWGMPPSGSARAKGTVVVRVVEIAAMAPLADDQIHRAQGQEGDIDDRPEEIKDPVRGSRPTGG